MRPPPEAGPRRRSRGRIPQTRGLAGAESARLESLGFELCMHARLGEVEFFWHDATEAFGYCIEVITAGPGIDGFFDTIVGGARGWDGRDPIRGLG